VNDEGFCWCFTQRPSQISSDFLKKVMLIALFGIVEKETGFFPKR